MRKTHIPPTVFDQACYHVGCATIHLWRAVVAISTLKIWTAIITAAILLAFVISLTGCGGIAGIKLAGSALMGGVQVDAPKDPGKPATVDTSAEQAGVIIPKGSAVVVTKTGATAATETAPAKPAVEVISFTPSADTEYKQASQKVAASTGAVDTSVAIRNADNAARAPLLLVAVGCLVAGLVVAVVLKHPAIGGIIAVGGGGGAIAAWKLAEVPAWVFGVGLLCAFLAWAFYTRGQWDRDGDGKPDFLQKEKA